MSFVIRRSIWGWSLFADGELIASADRPGGLVDIAIERFAADRVEVSREHVSLSAQQSPANGQAR